MKKLIAVVIGIAICLSVNAANAYMFNDAIGDALGGSGWETFGMDVSFSGNDILFQIYTNYDNSYYVSDFAIDVDKDSKYEYGLALNNHFGYGSGIDKNGFYQVDTSLSQDGTLEWVLINGQWTQVYNDKPQIRDGWYIPEQFDHYNPDVPVAIAGSTKKSTNTSISWDTAGGSPDHRVSFTLNKNDFLTASDTSFDFFYGTAVCGNDVFSGTVNVIPEPASMLLFGIGMLGFGIARRKKSI